MSLLGLSHAAQGAAHAVTNPPMALITWEKLDGAKL